MRQRQIHFIGGEKGGVGKSVVARLLAQYWIDQQRDWRGFDTDLSHGALLRYYSDFATPLDINRIEQLDAVMETALEHDRNVLVDLAAQTEAPLHRWVDDSGVLEMARDIGLGVRFWHVMDEGKDSVNLLGRLLERHGDAADYVIVLNQGRGDDFGLYRDSPVAEHASELAVPTLELKALHKPTMRKIDQYDKSFWAAVNNTDPALGECLGMMERQRVRIWLKNAYDAFAALGV